MEPTSDLDLEFLFLSPTDAEIQERLGITPVEYQGKVRALEQAALTFATAIARVVEPHNDVELPILTVRQALSEALVALQTGGPVS